MSQFHIHPQLIADNHLLGKLTYCYVLLNKNATLPWFILVPEVNATNLLDISAGEREPIMNECAQISNWIKLHFGISRINFGAIGNIVPQLHLHVIGRSEADACWPKPAWGNLQAFKDYAPDEITRIRQQLVTDHQLAI